MVSAGKVKYRDAIVGAVTGSLDNPEVLVVGRYRGKELGVSAVRSS